MKLEEQFKKPIEVSDSDIALGGDIKTLLPDYKKIPEEFYSSNNKWCKIQICWFFNGLPKETKWIPKEGIDVSLAIRHLKAIQRSWNCKHEYKESGVAYLMSLWFDDIIIPR